jgi:hypothetical protein
MALLRTLATFSSLQAINRPRLRRAGGAFDLDAFLAGPVGSTPPGDWLSDPRGVFRLVRPRDDKGGFAWDTSCVIDGTRGCFVENRKKKSP